MGLITKTPRGTTDKLPAEINKWHTIEKKARDIAETYGCKEIRTPEFEHTELFRRGVGDTTDVVQKEMYTFIDKKGRSITLKPEGTAGAVRAAVENGLLTGILPLKLYYFTKAFRYEAPESGRLREFNQFGVEVFGTNEPASDAEVISLAWDIIKNLGLTEQYVTLEINSIGCPECRAAYQNALRSYYSQYKDKLCGTCLNRLEKNPMRLLDCKSEICGKFAENAPIILDYLCEDCRRHFDSVKEMLNALEIQYSINPRIVRGLDYYTNTVFEFISAAPGYKGTICAGGRYNGLVREIGGPETPGLGFAMGMERIIMVMEALNAPFEPPKACDIYIASLDKAASVYAMKLVRQLRDFGFWAESDLTGRSLKAQMKYADKIGAKFSIVIGSNEIETGIAALKNMSDGTTVNVSIKGNIAENINTLLMEPDIQLQ